MYNRQLCKEKVVVKQRKTEDENRTLVEVDVSQTVRPVTDVVDIL